MRAWQIVPCLIVAVIGAACSSAQTTPATTLNALPSTPSTSQPAVSVISNEAAHGAVSRFLRLAETGSGGTFTASYTIEGDTSGIGGGNGKVQVAQSAPAGPKRTYAGAGRWSYLLEMNNGAGWQWIEDGSRVEDCWRHSVSTGWKCYGPAPFEPSNGSLVAILPFLPGTALQAIKDIASGQGMYGPQTVSIVRERETSTSGPLTCIRDRIGTGTGSWCLTKSGFFAGSSAPSGGLVLIPWRRVSLVSISAAVDRSDFVPIGQVQPGFRLPPEG